MGLNVTPETADATQGEKTINTIVKDIKTLKDNDETNDKLDISGKLTKELASNLMKDAPLLKLLQNSIQDLYEGINSEAELKAKYGDKAEAIIKLNVFVTNINNEKEMNGKREEYNTFSLAYLVSPSDPNGRVLNSLNTTQRMENIQSIKNIIEESGKFKSTLQEIQKIWEKNTGDIKGLQNVFKDPKMISLLQEQTGQTSAYITQCLSDGKRGEICDQVAKLYIQQVNDHIQLGKDIADYNDDFQNNENTIFDQPKIDNDNNSETHETTKGLDLFPEDTRKGVENHLAHFNTIKTEWNSLNIWNSNTRNLIGGLINNRLQPKDKENAQKKFTDIEEIKDKINNLGNNPEDRAKEQNYGKKIANLKADLGKQLEKGFINNIKNTIIDTYKNNRTDYKKITDIENNQNITSEAEESQLNNLFQDPNHVEAMRRWYTDLENSGIKIVGTIDEPKVKLEGPLKKYFKDNDEA